MRFLMLSQSPDAVGPAPGIARLLTDELRRLGSSVVTHPWGRSSSEETIGGRALGTLRDVRSAYRVTRGQAFDLVLVHTAHDWRTLVRDIPLALAVRRRALPVVLHLHGSQPERLVGSGHRAFRAATALLLRSVDAVFVLSREEQTQWRAFSSRVPVLVVRNPYAARASALPLAASPRDDVPTVLFVGRLLREKGVFDLLEAMPLVAERARCRLVLVGDGPCARELEERVSTLGIANDVTFTGFLTGDDLRRAYVAADVFALPTYYAEGFPTVLAEAMEAGLPIVTTRIRGAADHLVDGEHALFVEPRNAERLAGALVALLEDPSVRLRMGDANRRRLSRFEPPVVARGYLEALESVAGGRPHGPRET